MSSKLFSETTVRVGRTDIHVGFTSVDAGNLGMHVGDEPERVQKNRLELEHNLGVFPRRFTYINQVHGIDIYDADNQVDGVPTADASVTSTGVPLAVMVADCIPIVFVGEDASNKAVLAVAHAGRKGLLDGVIQNTVEEMKNRGALRICVWLGPSICGQCYEVPDSMREKSEQIIKGIGSETSWHTPALDLPAAAVAILESLPVVAEIHRELATCTLEEEQVFSHRRGKPQGRIAGLVWSEE